MYLTIKYAHLCFALISINLFILRAVWTTTESQLQYQRWTKIVPHINDTLLFTTAIYLMVATQQYPFSHGWLTIKLFAVLIYIVLGSIALKRATTRQAKLFFALLAIAMFGFIGWTAISH